jgi:ketosteroid isomerase-like protein
MLKQLTERYIAAFASKDLVGIAELMREDFVLEDPVVKRVEGKAPALDAVEKLFLGCKELDFRAKQIFQDGDSTMIEFVLELDGICLEGVDIIDWRNGRMLELRAYLDIPKGD